MMLMVIHELLCGILFYTVFCRAVRINKDVRLDVRIAFQFMGMVACAGVVAPVAWKWAPDLMSVSLLLSICIVQVVTARYWDGVPENFLKPGKRKWLRRVGDRTPSV